MTPTTGANDVTTVVLTGRPGATTHRAVEVLASLPAELRLIGGLAVMCRVGMPHRATVDLDAITRGLEIQAPLIARLAVTASDGGQYTFEDDLELDVIDVAPLAAGELAAEWLEAGPLTDLELNAVGHTWAHDTATAVNLVVISDEDSTLLASAPRRLVASPGGLVAMKATTVPLRASARPEKRASDLYDLARLLVRTDGVGSELAAAPEPLRAAVVERLHGWFVDPTGRDRTYRDVRRFDDPPADLDDVADAVEELN